uniref:aminopeptidase B n=1 Tax=Panthera onca TaxID=9690 RepID=UPI0029552BF8|nr:aminopeptidase B [Panthera onca]
MASDGPPSGCSAAPRPLHSAQAVDVASASNFRAFEMLHLHLDLRAEFGPPGPGPGSRNLSGTAVLELRCLVPEGATELRLDSHPCLEVTAASLRRQRPDSKEQPAEPVHFRTQPFSHYGQALCVALPQPFPAGERFQVLLTYRVGEGPGVSSPPHPATSCPPFQPSELAAGRHSLHPTPRRKKMLLPWRRGASGHPWAHLGFLFVLGSAYTCLEAATGRALLRQHMDITGEENPLNKLRVKIEPGVDPDDTYNETPYEKGFCFVSYLAHLVGDQDEFDNFLKAYVNEFKFQSILADDFLEFYLEYFPELKKKRVDSIPGFEFDRWLNTPGWPPYLPDLSPGDSLMKPAEELAQLWVTRELDMKAIEAVAISTWKTYQLVYFLDKILQKSPLPPGNVKKLGETYPKISNSRNAELRLRWGQIVIKNDHQEDFWKVKEFLQSQGKQKYTLPLYHAMMGGSEVAQTLAKETFKATAPQLHSNVVNYVQQIVAPKGS